MLILRMDSKRERRPNVRLGEVGDFPAAFACGFSPRYGANAIRKRRNHGFASLDEPEKSSVLKETPTEPGGLVDPPQCREDENPDPLKPTPEAESSGEVGMTKCELDFGTITRKCRVMKRRCRSAVGSNRVFASGWGFFTHSPEIADESEGKASVGFAKTSAAPTDESNGLSGRETSTTSGEGTEDATVSPGAGLEHGAYDARVAGPDDSSSVREWLEESGFGKYADMFEMHEVDMEALPLLTLQDLGEMGVRAVGPRRKLYSAIRQLAGDPR